MSTTTRALVLRSVKNSLRWETVVLGPLRPDELLVDIHATGICHTDVACMNGTLPMRLPQVLGHEGAGVVSEVGADVLGVYPGDKVILSYNHCGFCHQCTVGHPAYCESLYSLNFGGRRSDGSAPLSTANKEQELGNFFGQSSFSRRAIVNKRCVVKVDDDTDLVKFAPLGCGLQTGAGVVLNTLNIRKGSSFVVFGAGAVGMSAIMAARIRAAHPIIAVDLHAKRRQLAKELGADFTIAGSDSNVIEQIRLLSPSLGAEFAVDTTGVPSVIGNMIESLGIRGKAASVGSPAPGYEVKIEVFSHLNYGREYVGCTQGDSIAQQMVPYLMNQHKRGNYPFHRLIKYYAVEDFEMALNDMKDGNVYKPVLKWV